MKPVLTTGDVANYCHVSLPTVFRWIKNGHLPAYTLPNGHHRILPQEFRAFLERHRMPVCGGVFQEEEARRRILVVDGDLKAVKALMDVLTRGGDRFDVACTNGVFEAGMLMTSFQPHLVVLDLMISGARGFEVLQDIQANPDTAEVKILVLTGPAEPETIQRILALGADDVMGRPLASAGLLAKVERLLALGPEGNMDG
jgi:excisionase family DNA binding protein